MRLHKSLTASLAALVLAAVAMGQTPPTAPPPTKLAVVNIVKLFDMLQEKIDADRDIEKMKTTYGDEARKRQTALETMSKDLQSFRADSADYNKMQDELLQKSMDLQAYGQFTQQKMFMELRLKTMLLYRNMNAAIEKHAQANGIAIVFVADDLNLQNARTQQDLQAMVTVRKVVYYHPAYDITNAIIERMNTDYKLGAGKK